VKAAIIAAGQGERLRAAGIAAPKPLVAVCGKPLIDHVLDAVAAAGIRDVTCLFNEEDESVANHCRKARREMQLRVVRRTTPSSMESLFTLAPHLAGQRFLLLTVDAVFGPRLLPAFLEGAERTAEADVVLAVHRFVDDEKPLRVVVDERGRVTALGADASSSPVITAGLYVLDPRIFAEIDAARAAKLGALRQFFALLLARGYAVHAVEVEKTIDVDRPEDIAAAEAFVRGGYRS
jgi:NDP-sugar pyrophosphorylase family protein